MSNEKKQVKTNDLFASAFKSAPDKFWDLLQEMKYTYTTMSLMARLYKYFSTENGRQAQKKLFYYCDLKNELGKNGKPASRNTIENSIKEIKESNLFIVNEDWKGKEKTVCFYIPNEKNLSIFEKVENNLGKFHQETFEFYKENNIIDINKSSHLINLSSQSKDLSSHSFDTSSQANDFSNQMNDVEIKKSIKTCQANDFSINVKSLVNNGLDPILEISKESYIKESISKEALLQEPLLVNSENSSLEKKLLDSELKVKAFLKSDEIIKREEKEIESNQLDQVEEIENISTSKNDNELDRLKSILMCDYQMYESIAEEILKTYSIQCINDCIDLTIDAEVNDKIKSTPRDFLRNKLKYWTEKKETTQEVTLKSSSPKNISLPGEQDFINIIYSKKLVHISQKNLNDCVQALITCAKKDLFLEIKEKFSREQLGQFINAYQNTFTFAYKYTNDVARFWQFFNDINELDKYVQELKERNEKSRLEILEKFKNSMKKDDSKDTLIQKIDTFSNLNDLVQDDDNENIPY